MSKTTRPTGLVYSTGQGRMCPGCGQQAASCSCRAKPAASGGDGIIRVGRATRGRKGSGVTVITGLALNQEQLRELAGRLKKQCGAGGAVKDGTIEIQGEHREFLTAALQQLGYAVRRAGG